MSSPGRKRKKLQFSEQQAVCRARVYIGVVVVGGMTDAAKGISNFRVTPVMGGVWT